MGAIGNALHALLLCGEELRAEFAAKTPADESTGRLPSDKLTRKDLDDKVLGLAQELGATLLVHQNRVICSIRGITRDGASYSDAALNTIQVLLKPATDFFD